MFASTSAIKIVGSMASSTSRLHKGGRPGALSPHRPSGCCCHGLAPPESKSHSLEWPPVDSMLTLLAHQ